jgi:hypothetical protein
MEAFSRLFGSLLAFVYHCFDRIVIQGYLPLLSRPENIVYFFRNVHGIEPITQEVLRKRTNEYNRWVDSYARNHRIPIQWAEKAVRKEDVVSPYLRRMARQDRFGVYFIFKSLEVGPTFRSSPPKYATDDPHYRILRRQRSRYTHYYFYIRDQVLGPMVVCVGSFLPFQTTYYLNGHHFIERQLQAHGIAYRKDDNAFVSTADPQALQAAADRLSASIIRERLHYWSWFVGPKFSRKDRQAIGAHRHYSINQVEYCRNFIFRKDFPIHKLFERSTDMGLLRLSADRVSQLFGFRVNRRLRGKLASVLEKIDHGHHVLRACGKKAVLRMYEKMARFLRVEVLSNRLKDFGLNKGLDNLGAVRQTLAAVTDRFAAFEAEALNVHVDFPLLQHLALPIASGRTKIPGIKIHDTRLVRLMEVLLHQGTQITGWRTADIHRAILTPFDLRPEHYTITQLRYDLRKMKAHGLIQRHGRRYAYRLTDKGIRVALLVVLFHKRVCGPLANSLFARRPQPCCLPVGKIEAAYHKVDSALDNLLELLAA